MKYQEIAHNKDGLDGDRSWHICRKVPYEHVRKLWHCDYWDGPLSGICIVDGRRLFFKCVSEDVSRNREFVLLQLSQEQLAEEIQWHELFREHVGTHTDYDENNKRETGKMKPQNRWDGFYVPYKKRTPLDLSSCEIIGWTTDAET